MFADRMDAGLQLAEKLKHYTGRKVFVLALPRGGVVTRSVIARAVGAPLDVIIVKDRVPRTGKAVCANDQFMIPMI